MKNAIPLILGIFLFSKVTLADPVNKKCSGIKFSYEINTGLSFDITESQGFITKVDPSGRPLTEKINFIIFGSSSTNTPDIFTSNSYVLNIYGESHFIDLRDKRKNITDKSYELGIFQSDGETLTEQLECVYQQ